MLTKMASARTARTSCSRRAPVPLSITSTGLAGTADAATLRRQRMVSRLSPQCTMATAARGTLDEAPPGWESARSVTGSLDAAVPGPPGREPPAMCRASLVLGLGVLFQVATSAGAMLGDWLGRSQHYRASLQR